MISTIPGGGSPAPSAISTDSGTDGIASTSGLDSPDAGQVTTFQKAMADGKDDSAGANTDAGTNNGSEGDTILPSTSGPGTSDSDITVSDREAGNGTTIPPAADGDDEPLPSPDALLASLSGQHSDETDELGGDIDTTSNSDPLAHQGGGGVGLSPTDVSTVATVGDVNAVAGTLPAVLEELVAAIKVSEPGGVGGGEIILEIKPEVMPGTSVRISMVDGVLQVEINTGEVGSGMLAGHVEGLEAQLTEALGITVDVSVNVDGNDVTAQLADNSDGSGSDFDGSGDQGSESQDADDQSAEQHQPDDSDTNVIDEDGLVEPSPL